MNEAPHQEFYPDDRDQLFTLIDRLLRDATDNRNALSAMPKAIIVPHSSCERSAEIAATAYARLPVWRSQIRRVVLLGNPSSGSLEGITLSKEPISITPLGEVCHDREWASIALGHHETSLSDRDFEQESSLTVQIPFLQYCLDDFSLLPLLVGSISTHSAAEILMSLWGADETLFVVSANLSCFHRYEEAETRDALTIHAMEQLGTHLTFGQSNGYHAINGLLKVAQKKGLNLTTLDRGYDELFSGGEQYIEGYAAFALH